MRLPLWNSWINTNPWLCFIKRTPSPKSAAETIRDLIELAMKELAKEK